MIANTEKVFDGVLRDSTELFSDAKYDEMLGSGDNATIEVEVEDVVSGSATLTVRWWHSISGKSFVVFSTLVSGQSLASLPFRALYTVEAPYGRLGRIGLMLSTTGVVRARAWVTNRMT